MISSTLRLSARRMAMAHQRRAMGGGGHAPAPKWEGIDKVVRDVFPEDWQIAVLVLGGYGSLFGLYKLSSAMRGKPKVVEEAPKPVVVSAPVSSGIPSADSPGFSDFLNSDAFLALLDNEDQLNKAIEAA